MRSLDDDLQRKFWGEVTKHLLLLTIAALMVCPITADAQKGGVKGKPCGRRRAVSSPHRDSIEARNPECLT